MTAHGPRDTMVGHVDAYLARMRNRASKSTRANTCTTLYRFAEWWDTPPRKVPRNLREAEVERFVWGRHDCVSGCRGRVHRGPGLSTTYSPDSLNHSLAHLRAFFGWAVRYSMMRPEVLEPVGSHRRARPRRVRRLRLSADQLVAMIHGCEDPWERAVVALATYTAGRASELHTLRVGDVDLDAGEIVWTRHKVRQDDDYLPITADLADELERWFVAYEKKAGPLRDDWYLIPRRDNPGRTGPDRFRYHPDQQRGPGLWTVVKRHVARVLDTDAGELNGVGVHTVRRSMARVLFERLIAEKHPDPLGVVQALLGHTNRAQTERYIGEEVGRRARDTVLRGRSMFGRGGDDDGADRSV